MPVGTMLRSAATAVMLMAVSCGCALAGEVKVAVATNFAGPMGRIAESFSAATGHTALLSIGSTGKFYAQIRAGAPFEVFLAADDETPKRLLAEGHALAGTNFTYAVGRLVLWSARSDFVDEQAQVLHGGSFAHLAIANPKTAPYGAAAIQVLKARGLDQTLAPKLVTAESIAQAYQFVVTGNAELGFVALSQVSVPGKPVIGSRWLVPSSLHQPILQDAVLLLPGAANPAARALLEYLKSAPVRQLIRSYGYGG